MARPPKRKRLSPPERKALSLSKDRRGDWWGKQDRNGIRGRVRAAHLRIARREDMRLLIDDPDTAEARFALRQRRRWRKDPGHTLGEEVARTETRRATAYRRKDKTFVSMKVSTHAYACGIEPGRYLRAIRIGVDAIDAGASRAAALSLAMEALR